MSNPLRTYSDLQLISAIRSGDETAESCFAEFYSRYSRRVFLYCSRILEQRSAAEDVLQECFVDFLLYVRQTNEISNITALLMRIARNRCLNLKRNNRNITIPIEGIELPDYSPEHHTEEIAGLIAAALDLLSDEYREAIVLQLYNGMTYQEIAELTQVPVTTVRNRIVRAKKRLREILQTSMDYYR